MRKHSNLSRQYDRREYLAGIGALGAAALAGCVGGQNGSGNTETQSGQNGGGSKELHVGGVAPFNLGDWSKFTEESGWKVNYVTISNSPGTLFSTLMSGGGRDLYDLFEVVGGFQKPLVQQDLIKPIQQDSLENLSNQYEYWKRDDAARFFMYDGKMYGTPILWQGDSLAYLPNETGREITSYGALFDEEFKGKTAIEDNYTTAGQKTALYLKKNNQADIDNPANMTEDEIATVVDFLIEKKKAGQFRTMWSGFQTAVSLMAQKEVVVMDTWEPVVFSLQDKGIEAKYAKPDEGYLLWADVNYVINPSNERAKARTNAIYNLMDFQLAGYYGAAITLQTGYMTSPMAIEYAKNSDEFNAKKVEDIHKRVQTKFEDVGGTWQQRWPDNREAYERHWQRLRNA